MGQWPRLAILISTTQSSAPSGIRRQKLRQSLTATMQKKYIAVIDLAAGQIAAL
jgi:hypothetical protein